MSVGWGGNYLIGSMPPEVSEKLVLLPSVSLKETPGFSEAYIDVECNPASYANVILNVAAPSAPVTQTLRF